MSSGPQRWTVDANVILRYLLKDQPELAARAREIWRSVEEGGTVAVCDAVTVAEAVFVMASVYKLPRSAISEALVALLQPEGVVMAEKERYLRALRLFGETVRHFGDACACATALEASEGRLYSFDRELSEVEGIEGREAPKGPGEP
jgi:predicted nucleic acid-binding protein